MKRLITFLFVLLCPVFATAQLTPFTPVQCSGSHMLNAVALNAAEASRTFYVGPTFPTCAGTSGKSTLGYNKLLILAYFDYTANAGTITLTCTGGPTQATATYYLTTCTLAAGTCTLNWSGVSTTASLSADTKWEVLMGIKGNPAIKCVASHGGAPGATDTITVDAYLIAD